MTNLLPEERKTLQTYEKVASIWTRKYSPPNFWAEEMKKFRQLLPGGTVLEIGAGGGRDAKELIELGYNYVGTDISEKLLEKAREKLPGQKFYKQSVYDLNFTEKFNGFWASKVLLHVPKNRIDEALARIKSVTKRGGIGFISLIDGKGEELREEIWDDKSRHQRFFAYWSKKEFQRVLDNNGFNLSDYSFRPETKRLRWHCFFIQSNK